eukprot:gene7781-25667_t
MEFFDPHFHIWDLETPAAEGAGYPLASGHDAAILFPPGGNAIHSTAAYEKQFELVSDTIEHVGGAWVEAASVCHVDMASEDPGYIAACLAELCNPTILYEGDTYAGGNPWILTSGCLAQLYYRAASAVATGHFYAHGDVGHVRAWMRALPSAASSVNATVSRDILREEATAAELASAMLNAGDGVLDRIKYHTQGNKLHQPEQLDRDSGVEKSATDLTWSYATILKAMVQRSHAKDAIQSL